MDEGNDFHLTQGQIDHRNYNIGSNVHKATQPINILIRVFLYSSKLTWTKSLKAYKDIDDESDGDDVMIFLFFSWDGTTSKRDVSE
ncbi:hypothetical protein P8452_63423 [Trifolium repens]|nr:hypothetical protein P8452_63423 [Trifolium repens]